MSMVSSITIHSRLCNLIYLYRKCKSHVCSGKNFSFSEVWAVVERPSSNSLKVMIERRNFMQQRNNTHPHFFPYAIFNTSHNHENWKLLFPLALGGPQPYCANPGLIWANSGLIWANSGLIWANLGLKWANSGLQWANLSQVGQHKAQLGWKRAQIGQQRAQMSQLAAHTSQLAAQMGQLKEWMGQLKACMGQLKA